ncbi:conserved hypothetical protein [Aurantimonas manganoxydans SI85-9A1]|uniref:Cytoplasmic protein n=1 Tax=Aurantimonas manganoxydans (strain ATCC BAA-1229 / DSM 21871 / SI85-9A1) TaxID=287752 RepID=Q1YJU0_AURMS|nr:DUF1788 domain-containing protein [Aurantimonas manganoxydans]EAS50783.1 conserved hypothetical protein [Aurantimonas manganoxydans SI85-9A1]
MNNLEQRLGAIQAKITSKEFLTGRQLGGDIPYWIFDYPPADELRVREHVNHLLRRLNSDASTVKACHVDLLDLVKTMLEGRRLLDRAIEMQKNKGNAAVSKALAAEMDPERIADAFIKSISIESCSFVLVTGVGASYPLVRTHSLMNTLHSRTGHVPIVFFYPGRYDGQYLRLFDATPHSAYYRAFRLVSDSEGSE